MPNPPIASRRWVLAATLALGLAACHRPDDAATGQAQVGGPFQLVDQDGQAVNQTLLNGKWSAIYFGYTSCPDVCPTTMQNLRQAQELMGADAARLQVVFISIDPERDTPAQLKTYLSSPVFPKHAIGLTGTPAQVAAAAKAYKAYYKKEGSGSDYSMDHVSLLYLMDPKGRFAHIVAPSQGPAEIAAAIKQAMRE